MKLLFALAGVATLVLPVAHAIDLATDFNELAEYDPTIYRDGRNFCAQWEMMW